VRESRRYSALTQEQLAARTGFSRRAIQDWEAGFVPGPRGLAALSRVTGRPVEWFLSEELEVAA
jgi:transcriptional regulator with XRE-family HTH domain